MLQIIFFISGLIRRCCYCPRSAQGWSTTRETDQLLQRRCSTHCPESDSSVSVIFLLFLFVCFILLFLFIYLFIFYLFIYLFIFFEWNLEIVIFPFHFGGLAIVSSYWTFSITCSAECPPGSSNIRKRKCNINYTIVKFIQLCSKFPPTAFLNFACDWLALDGDISFGRLTSPQCVTLYPY